METYEETFAADNTPEDIEVYLACAFAPEKMEQELNNPASAFYLARKNGCVIGYLKLNDAQAQTELNDGKSLEIERIYVLKKFHGAGYGWQLLEKAIAYARKRSKEYVWLGVWEKNQRALRFYEKNGFRRFGEHTFRLGSDEQLDYLLRKDILPL